MITLDTGDRLLRASFDKLTPYLEGDTGICDYIEVPTKIPNIYQAPEAQDYFLDNPIDNVTSVPQDPGHDSSLHNEAYMDDIHAGIMEADQRRFSASNSERTASLPPDVAFFRIHFTEVLRPGDPRSHSPPLQK